jgi:SAM-dependent methyltransferase
MSTFHNRTRRSPSIPRKLLREGKFHLIPIYYLMWTSALGREGIENSGSYRFADHIYEGRPKGRYGIGRVIDAMLLKLKSAKALRARHIYSKEEVVRYVSERLGSDQPIDILSVPCGLARELLEIGDLLGRSAENGLPPVRYYGMDLDSELIQRLNATYGDRVSFWVGDALNARSYPMEFDVIVSNGFCDFLNDELTAQFYEVVRTRLKPGGRFVTSGMRPHRISEYLMRNLAELTAIYRSEHKLRELARAAGFGEIHTYQNEHQLQTMLIGVRT